MHSRANLFLASAARLRRSFEVEVLLGHQALDAHVVLAQHVLKLVSAAAGAPSEEPLIQMSSNTVDIRGMRSELAMEEVDEFLSKTSSTAAFIVHGKGTGQLRQQVHDLCSKHPAVASFELQRESAGGCTVAMLK